LYLAPRTEDRARFATEGLPFSPALALFGQGRKSDKLRGRRVTKPPAIISRYTNLASAIDILKCKRLALLDPDAWPDRNDRACLRAYVRAKHLCGVRVLCFAGCAETAHHWSAFAPGSDGVRLDFHRETLEKDVQAAGAKLGKVNYSRIKDFRPSEMDTDKLPFTKRSPYQNEAEWRLLKPCDSSDNLAALEPYQLPLSEAALKAVSLSPVLPINLADPVRDTLRALWQGSEIKISRSTLLGNPAWLGRLEDM
jgi:hypothetical protein